MGAGWWSLCRDLGEGCSGGGFVDDGLAGGERGDEGWDGEVVDRSRDPAAALVDKRDRVVGEQRVRAAGECEVVGQVALTYDTGAVRVAQ